MSNVSEYIVSFLQSISPIPEIIIWVSENPIYCVVIGLCVIFIYKNFSKIVRYLKYNIF